jgi:hypothetical protein
MVAADEGSSGSNAQQGTSSSSSEQQQGASSSSSAGPTPTQAPLNWSALNELVTTRKVDFAMWITRLLTLLFAVGFIIPLFG